MFDNFNTPPPDSDSTRLITYSDSAERFQVQLPLALSWLTVSGYRTPDVLFNDNSGDYLDFPAGAHQTAMYIQTQDRYSGLSITLISGSINVLVQLSEYFSDPNPAFIAAPYTLSGEAGEQNVLLASYYADTPNNPYDYWMPLTSPGTYKIAFPQPLVGNTVFVTHSGSTPYRISQILPRKSVQAYDIEVNSIKAYHISSTLIDTIALQVSDSIVVGPELIGAKSIDGSKIIDGTISGVLIQNGTVTGNKILAGTISGVLIQAGTIIGDNIAANTIDASKVTTTFIDTVSAQVTDSLVIGSGQIANKSIDGSKIADGTISGVLIRDGTIFANKIAAGTITATQIAVSGITADNLAARVITAEKIVLSGITAELLGAEAVTAAALASGAVVSGKLAADSVYASNIVGGQITAYHVAANTITGDRIQANTISGALITAGTITSTNIAVSGITADRLSVTQLDAVAADMGTLVVNSGITVGTNGYITVPSGYISAGKAKLDSTGLHIGDVASSNLPSITDTLRIAGSGSSGNIVGMAFYNGAFSATNPQAVLQLDSTNALELEMRTISGMVNINFPEETLTGQFFQVYNADLYLKRSPGSPINIPPGAIYGTDSDGTVRYYMGHDELTLNNNTEETFRVNAGNGTISTLGNIHVGSGEHVFTVNGNSGTLHVGPPPHVFRVNGESGDTHIEGTLTAVGDVGFGGTYSDKVTIQGTTGNTVTLGTLSAEGDVGFGTYFDKFTVASTTGDTAIAGTLAVTGQTTLGALNASGTVGFGTSNNKLTVAAATGNTAIAGTLGVTGKFTASNLAYGTFTRTADLAITTAGTTITWQSSPRSNNVTYSTTDITVGNTGYYLITGYFATLGNVSLRMTLQRSSANHTSIQQVTPLSTGGGYLFNFSNAVYLSANSVLKVILTPSANTTLNQNTESGAAPSPFLHIIQLAGI